MVLNLYNRGLFYFENILMAFWSSSQVSANVDTNSKKKVIASDSAIFQTISTKKGYRVGVRNFRHLSDYLRWKKGDRIGMREFLRKYNFFEPKSQFF